LLNEAYRLQRHKSSSGNSEPEERFYKINVPSLNLYHKMLLNISFLALISHEVVAKPSKGLDINRVVRSQMENLIQGYNTQKMAPGHFYETLKDTASLKLIKDDLMIGFQKTKISTGRQLLGFAQKEPTIKMPNQNEKNGIKSQIRKNRLKRLQKHYGKSFERSETPWYAPLLDPLISME